MTPCVAKHLVPSFRNLVTDLFYTTVLFGKKIIQKKFWQKLTRKITKNSMNDKSYNNLFYSLFKYITKIYSKYLLPLFPVLPSFPLFSLLPLFPLFPLFHLLSQAVPLVAPVPPDNV